MTSWQDFRDAAPELAERAEAAFTATTNAVLATTRKDGSPRVSGIDPMFFEGDLWLGSMPDARKADDLLRDPRMALHCVPWESRQAAEGDAGPGRRGDAKLTGRAVDVADRATIDRVVGAASSRSSTKSAPQPGTCSASTSTGSPRSGSRTRSTSSSSRGRPRAASGTRPAGLSRAPQYGARHGGHQVGFVLGVGNRTVGSLQAAHRDAVLGRDGPRPPRRRCPRDAGEAGLGRLATPRRWS